jgi:hypothetical protein
MSGFDYSKFVNPPKSARPMARWWWPGLDVDKDELMREIADMDAANFAGGEVQAFCDGIPPEIKSDPGEQKKLHRYRTGYYFDVISSILEEMKKRGMTLDLTACSGWPANGTDVPLTNAQKHMYMYTTTVDGGREVTLKLPSVDDLLKRRASEKGGSAVRMPAHMRSADDTESLRANLRMVGVSAAKCVGAPVDAVMTHPTENTGRLEKPVDLWSAVSGDSLTWNFPEGTWQVFTYFAGPNGSTSHMASVEEIGKPNYIVDHFGKDIISGYLDRHIGEGGWDKYMGDTLRAFFTDSFELSSPWTWTDKFFEEFKARRGYDLRPYLMLTSVPGNDSMFTKMMGIHTPPMYDIDGVGDRVRHDYELTIADIFDDYFLVAMKEWGDAHKLKSRVQCYGHSMDNIKAFGRTAIPETEQLAGNGIIDFMKLAGSASLLYSLPLVTSETLVWIRHDYMTTPAKIKIAADRLFVSGVNQLIYHGMPYRHSGMEFPHFYPFHGAFGSFICRDNTLWSAIGDMNLRIARSQQLMQSGPIACDVAVYYQRLDYVSGNAAMEELTAGTLPGFDRVHGLSAGHGDPSAADPTAEQARSNADFRLSHLLMGAGYDYFHINEECLLRAELIDGCLICGDAKFRALVIHDEEKLAIEAAYKLRSLMDAGFPVIFVGKVPSKVPGLVDYATQEAEMAKALDDAEAIPAERLADALNSLGVSATLKSSLNCLQHIRRTIGDDTLWFVRSSDAASHTADITLSGAKNGAVILDPETGGAIKPQQRFTDDGLRITLPFPAYGSWFILESANPPADTGDAALKMAFAACNEDGTELIPENGWRITGKNAVAGGADIDVVRETTGDWADDAELRGFSGAATYAASFHWNGDTDGIAIDLGKIGDAAEVILNGHNLGQTLCAPFILDTNGFLIKGNNNIEIRVTNTLRNALVAADAFKNGMMIGGPGPRELAMSGITGRILLKKF